MITAKQAKANSTACVDARLNRISKDIEHASRGMGRTMLAIDDDLNTYEINKLKSLGFTVEDYTSDYSRVKYQIRWS